MKYALISEEQIGRVVSALTYAWALSENERELKSVAETIAGVKALKPSKPVAWAAKSIYGGYEGLSFDKQPRFDTPLYALDEVTK